MLTLTLSVCSLLLISVYVRMYWWVITSWLFLLTFLFLPKLSISSTIIFTSCSILDIMTTCMLILSILVAAMMMVASSKIYLNELNSKTFATINILLLAILLMCFSSNSLIMFYIWFEASLIPTMLIIMLWGYQPERLQASMYLIMYTVTASLPMLIVLLLLTKESGHMSLGMNYDWSASKILTKDYLWLLALLGFLVKLPMFSVHLWLPKAHVEAPIAGSMVLAAILLKLGGYGIMRLTFTFNKYMNYSISSMLMSLSLIGAIITSMICLRQSDIKSLIAYSSVGHMGLLLAAMMSNNNWALWGALMIMVAHGLCSSALFALANITYELTHTRSMYLTKGILCIVPNLSMWWFLFTAWNMAAPPSINLMSEIILLTSILSTSKITMSILMLISFMSAAYSLNMYATTQHGHSPSFIKPLNNLKTKDMLLLTIHIYPILALITKPEIISLWN